MRPYDDRSHMDNVGRLHTKIHSKVATMEQAFMWPAFDVSKVIDDERRTCFPTSLNRADALDHLAKVHRGCRNHSVQ